MARSLNKVILIGNLTRDPELKYTPSGAAVCTIGLATNRQWKTESGEQKDDAEFHKLVAWNQLAEICNKMLRKGSKAYFEGRLQTRTWQGQDGQNKQTTEIVISDMIILDSRGGASSSESEINVPDDFGAGMDDLPESVDAPAKGEKKSKKKQEEDDIPF